MAIDYVLTSFSPAMFGEGATANIKIVEAAEAHPLVDRNTKIVATRVSHDRLARNQLTCVVEKTARYATLKGGVTAAQVLYRGQQVGEDGRMPTGGMATYYLVEVDEHRKMIA